MHPNDIRTKRRLPTKTINALEDIMALCNTIQSELTPAINRAEKTMDVTTLAALAKFSTRTAKIERIARKARNGEYDDD